MKNLLCATLILLTSNQVFSKPPKSIICKDATGDITLGISFEKYDKEGAVFRGRVLVGDEIVKDQQMRFGGMFGNYDDMYTTAKKTGFSINNEGVSWSEIHKLKYTFCIFFNNSNNKNIKEFRQY